MAHPDPLAVVVAKYEPRVRTALEVMLESLPTTAKLSTIEAFIRAGDLTGLADYVSALYIAAAPPFLAELRLAAYAAGEAAVADIHAAAAAVERQNRARMAANQRAGLTGAAVFTGTTAIPTTAVPLPDGSPTGIVFFGAEGFAFNPVNPQTVAATRTWQGNLIREMSESARIGILQTVREGLLAGENPREIARQVRVGLPLTSYQQRAVASFHADLLRIAEGGIRSATEWGLYTPRQIAALKLNDPAAYKALNFTTAEIKGGRRWGKISRATGTLAPVGGVKPSLPLGPVADKATQSGASAFRIDAQGRAVDRMTRWRLRDKSFDPLLYAIVEAREAGDAAAEAAARAKYEAKVDEMASRYRERYVDHRAVTIARTETLRAANLGSYESWRQAVEDSDLFGPGMVKRTWLTAGDDRVRLAHRAPIKAVGMREPFLVDGERVMLPPAGVNCRCTVRYSVDLSA